MAFRMSDGTDVDIQELARRIWHGQLESGEGLSGRLPSERVLGQRFGVGRKTVRRAFDHLEAEGLVYRLARGGTFVRPPVLSA